MKKNLLLLFSLIAIGGSVSAMEINNIDKATLTAFIKADIYRVFIQEMGILSKDFNAIAQNNAELEKDLKDLYASFAVSQEDAQKKLDAFCKKWNLEKIDIA